MPKVTKNIKHKKTSSPPKCFNISFTNKNSPDSLTSSGFNLNSAIPSSDLGVDGYYSLICKDSNNDMFCLEV